MKSLPTPFVLLFACALHAPAALALGLVVTSAKLPAPIELHSAVYDGDDSIYMIGGYDGLRVDSVLRFSIGTGAVTRIGTFERISQGTAALTPAGDIVYFGGKIHIDGYTSNVYRYSTTSNSYSVVNELPLPMRSMTSAHDTANNVVYNFGGINNNGFTYHDPILRYDIATNTLTQVGQLPEGRGAACAVFADDGNAYIFGGTVPINHESISDEILRFDPRSNTVTKLPAKLPSTVYYSSAVYAKGHAYISGQFDLLRFDPSSGQVEKLAVEGWPNYWLGAPVVYVPKLDRIYTFGGYGRYGAEPPRDSVDISYLDLSED